MKNKKPVSIFPELRLSRDQIPQLHPQTKIQRFPDHSKRKIHLQENIFQKQISVNNSTSCYLGKVHIIQPSKILSKSNTLKPKTTFHSNEKSQPNFLKSIKIWFTQNHRKKDIISQTTISKIIITSKPELHLFQILHNYPS